MTYLRPGRVPEQVATRHQPARCGVLPSLRHRGDDVYYIMETFPIVLRTDEAQFDDYRTKRLMLDIYDRMQRAIESGTPYQPILDPPRADPRVAHQGVRQEAR